MRSSHLLISLVGLLMGLCLVGVGLFLTVFPFIPLVATAVHSLVLHHLTLLSYVGLTLLIVGLLFLALLFRFNKRQYLLLKMGGVYIDEKVITACIDQALKELFPHLTIPCEALINRQGNLEIMATVPAQWAIEGAQELCQIEKKLDNLLRQQFQYDRPFIFNASFSI